MKNPFPGMNPWLEDYWRDIHASLLVYARNALNAALPAGLRARVDERLAVESEDENDPRPKGYLPDVAITESWDAPASATAVLAPPAAVAVAAARPVIVHHGEAVLRHLEIVNSREHVVTAIEVLSPSNKDSFEHLGEWRKKRADYIQSGIHLVEIDLLRGGLWVLPPRDDLGPRPADRVCYHVCVSRHPWRLRSEFYVLPLRERLPAVRVPLRPTDPDIALDLQALINQSYEDGRYGEVLRYDRPLRPALPEPEAAWARELLAGPAAPAPPPG